MENMKTVKSDITFPEYYAQTSPAPFYVAFGLFVLSNMLLVVNFTEPIAVWIEPARLVINSALMILCVMYIAFHILMWKLEPIPVIIAVGLIVVVGFGWDFIGQTNEFFCTAVAAVLALLAYKRDYKIILKIVLVCHIVTLLVGAVGLVFGFTQLAYKVQTVDNGYSLGLIYPNHVGRMVFLCLMIIWYLWGQEERLIISAACIAVAVLMYKVVNCRTIAVFLVAFPILWELHILFTKAENKFKPVTLLRKAWNIVLITLPFLCLLFTYIMGRNRSFFMQRWHFGQSIYSLWMRFISAGIIYETYGFPLWGKNVDDIVAPIEFNYGQIYVANIVDNAFVFYMLAIGGVAMVACMLWICFANYRAVKNNDHAFLLMSFLMCGYGILEIVFFQFEHNYLFFYPMTASALAYKQKMKAVVSDESDGQDAASDMDMVVSDESDGQDVAADMDTAVSDESDGQDTAADMDAVVSDESLSQDVKADSDAEGNDESPSQDVTAGSDAAVSAASDGQDAAIDSDADESGGQDAAADSDTADCDESSVDDSSSEQ